jgi:hypothetical protein
MIILNLQITIEKYKTIPRVSCNHHSERPPPNFYAIKTNAGRDAEPCGTSTGERSHIVLDQDHSPPMNKVGEER